MDKGIDASLGLDVALMTLQRLRKSGVLQADVSHIPGVAGRCRCTITIAKGNITSCYVEDAKGRPYALAIEVVVSVNQKKGPFAWSFHPQAPAPQQRSQPESTQNISIKDLPQQSPLMQRHTPPPMPRHTPPPQSMQTPPSVPIPWQFSDIVTGNTIPVLRRNPADLYLPNSLSANERVMLGWIFSLIDGQRTVAEITTMLPRLSFEDVRSGLVFLKQLGAIELVG